MDQSSEGVAHFQDQEDGPRDRERADKQRRDRGSVARRKEAEAREDDTELTPDLPPRFPRLEAVIALLVPAYAVRRARARRQLAAERIAAELAALNAQRPGPRRPSPWLRPTEFDVTPEGYRLPRPRR
jgi:hypothetical protein